MHIKQTFGSSYNTEKTYFNSI